MSKIRSLPWSRPSRRHRAKEFDDAAARAALAALTGPYLPWGVGAMRPVGLVEVCNDIVLRGRRRIVELGGGVSTVLIARLLAQGDPEADQRLITVEHDAGWARWLTGQLDREGLDRAVTVVHAPLAPHERAVGGLHWYDAAALEGGLGSALGRERIDLLVVDGPPAWAEGFQLARYPALPALGQRLAPGATIVLDDIDRVGEQQVLRRWSGETGIAFARRPRHSGIALAEYLPTAGELSPARHPASTADSTGSTRLADPSGGERPDGDMH